MYQKLCKVQWEVAEARLIREFAEASWQWVVSEVVYQWETAVTSWWWEFTKANPQKQITEASKQWDTAQA